DNQAEVLDVGGQAMPATTLSRPLARDQGEAHEARRDRPCASGRTIVQDRPYRESLRSRSAPRRVHQSRGANGEVVPAENGVVQVCAGRNEIVKERFMAKPVGPFSPWRRIGQTI